ncbi:MAG TPA: hypothetical protein VGM63_13345 [Mucilaginibacter sp.]
MAKVAKSHNITSKADFKLVSELTGIYLDQARIDKLEDKMADIFLRYESRKQENIRTTLILMSDNYKGWAFDRAPGLIQRYDEVIKLMESEGY